MTASSRRALAVGLAALALPAAALAEGPAMSLEGTWGGASGEVSAQVIVSGGQVFGFYWGGDYIDVGETRTAPDGSIRFDFAGGGHAALTRTGDGAARLEVWRGQRHDTMTLQRG